MNCPKCESEALGEVVIDETAVDQCPACKGIWFDAEELGQLLAEDAARVAALRRGSESEAADDKRGHCPRDDSGLLRIFSSIDRSVVLDVCPDCHGIWVDGGEFEKLFAARRK